MQAFKQWWHAIGVAALGLLTTPHAIADTIEYQFSGIYYVAGGAQTYTGTFSIADPQLTNIRPAMVPDLSNPAYQSIWQGTEAFYTGGSTLDIRFASGSHLTAPDFAIVVNNTTYQGTGSPYPQGLSVQLYPSSISVSAPTQNVCATPTGTCGPDDDPLYHDATQTAVMQIDNVYFAFYNAPLQTAPGMPNLVEHFGLNGGLGIRSGPTTTLTAFKSFGFITTAVSAVPEPQNAALMLTGLAILAAATRRRYAHTH